MLVWQGPEDASHRVVLAPGDAGRIDDAAPTLLAAGLAAAGIRVVRFAFPHCEVRDGAVRDALLEPLIRQAADGPGRLVLGGMSRGARVSASLVGELGAVGLLAFAFPFHPRSDPSAGPRLELLSGLPVPAWIGQGTRDSHGNRQQVRGYGLPSNVQVHWLEDANHALHPRARSGHTQSDQLTAAARVAAAWVLGLS